MIWQKIPVYFRLILFWGFLSSITSFPVDWNVDTSAEEERAKTCPRNMNASRGAYQRGHVPLFLPESHPHREEKICPTEGAISGGIIRGTAALQMECEVFKAYGHKFFICIRLWGRRGGQASQAPTSGAFRGVCVGWGSSWNEEQQKSFVLQYMNKEVPTKSVFSGCGGRQISQTKPQKASQPHNRIISNRFVVKLQFVVHWVILEL